MGNLEFTRDQIFSGKLVVFQPREGYRFSIEALLLAGFVRVRPRALVMDLGAGCGIISATLALRFPSTKMVALEIQERLSRALILTVRENRLEDRVLPVRGDLRSIPFKGERFDVVVANPPFKSPTAGRLPPDRENLLARTETLANLEDFLKAAYALLRPGGRVFLVYSALRTVDLIAQMRSLALELKRLRFVHSYPGDEGRFLLVEGIKGGGVEVRVLPPLFIYESPGGAYSEALARFFSAPEEGLDATL